MKAHNTFSVNNLLTIPPLRYWHIGGLLLLLSFASHANTFAVENFKLKERFVYKADEEDIWTVLADHGVVYGDCEDYALTLQKQVGGQLWYVKARDQQAHMILCLHNQCADNLQADIFTLDPTRFDALVRVYPKN